MKKFMLLTFVSAILAISAFAHDAKTQPASTPEQTLKAAGVKRILTDGTLWGTNSLSVDAFVHARNTSTSQDYYMTVSALNSNHITLPLGTYDIFLSTWSTYAHWYVSDDDDSDSGNGYNYTFYSVTITNVASTVISVSYP